MGLRCRRGGIKSWQVLGSEGEGIITMEEFGGEKRRFGVTGVCKVNEELTRSKFDTDRAKCCAETAQKRSYISKGWANA